MLLRGRLLLLATRYSSIAVGNSLHGRKDSRQMYIFAEQFDYQFEIDSKHVFLVARMVLSNARLLDGQKNLHPPLIFMKTTRNNNRNSELGLEAASYVRWMFIR